MPANNIEFAFLCSDTVCVIELAKKKTVTAADVLYALKKAGKTLYAVA